MNSVFGRGNEINKSFARISRRPLTFSFKPTGSIFKEREALLEKWTLDELIGRDEELTQYHAALQPVIEGETPSNIFIYGKSGVGKTAATRFLLERIEHDATGKSAFTINF